MIGVIPYLTLFRSRLGCNHLVLTATSTGFTPEPTLVRRLARDLESTCEVDLASPRGREVADYLSEKRFASPSPSRRTKYQFALPSDPATHGQLGVVSVQCVDFHLSSAAVRSTIGTPTTQNVGEYIDLATQLGYITKAKRNWTAAGQATHRLREARLLDNPFVLELDRVVALRQLLAADGLMIRHLLNELPAAADQPVSRDVLARDALLNVTEGALRDLTELRTGPRDVAAVRSMRAAVRKAVEGRGRASTAPGVLEHRLTPRLEWLVDIGALDKDGPERNSFRYRTNSDTLALRTAANHQGSEIAREADVVAGDWYLRSSFSRQGEALQLRDALRAAYEFTRRPVGPAAIRETVLIAAALSREHNAVLRDELLAWAADDPKVTVSGGRYSRSPELVHIAP